PIQFESRIDGQHAIRAETGIAARRENADAGLLADLAAHAHDAVNTSPRSTRPVVRHQAPERPPARLPGEAHAELWIRDAARKEQQDRRLEEAGVLQKERATLGKKHLEPLVDRH